MAIFGREAFAHGLAGEGGIDGIVCNGLVEVGHSVRRHRDELGGVFAAARTNEVGGVGVISAGGDFTVEITTEETFSVGIAIFLTSSVGGGGAGEEEVGVSGGEIYDTTVTFNLVEGGLEDDR